MPNKASTREGKRQAVYHNLRNPCRNMRKMCPSTQHRAHTTTSQRETTSRDQQRQQFPLRAPFQLIYRFGTKRQGSMHTFRVHYGYLLSKWCPGFQPSLYRTQEYLTPLPRQFRQRHRRSWPLRIRQTLPIKRVLAANDMSANCQEPQILSP